MDELLNKLVGLLESRQAEDIGIAGVVLGDDELIDLDYNGRVYRLEVADVGSIED